MQQPVREGGVYVHGEVAAVDAELRRVMHQPDRVRLGDGAAEGHGAEAQTGDGNAGSR